MIIYNGKNKDFTAQAILAAWLAKTRPIEPLEAVDFSKN